MALGQGLYQSQQQKLSPQQIQLMKLLQVPTANLEERIKEELEENPALELSDESEGDDLTGEIKDEFERLKYKTNSLNRIICIDIVNMVDHLFLYHEYLVWHYNDLN